MRPRLLLLCLALLIFGVPAGAQTTPKRDPTALTLIAQAVNAAGGATAIAAIQDYTATGTITYYWPGGPVQAKVTVKGRGPNQLRIDATLSQGVRSFGDNNGDVWQMDPDGTVRHHPFQHEEDPGDVIFPVAELAKALVDDSISVTDLGLVTVDGQQEHEVRLEKTFDQQDDRTGARAKMSVRDFFIDPSTYLVARTRDTIYQQDFLNKPVAHDVLYSGYRAFDGVAVAGTITQTIFHQRTFTIQLSQVSFNGGLTDSDFQP